MADKMENIGFTEQAICRKMGNVFVMAGQDGCCPFRLAEEWCGSDVAGSIYGMECGLIAQSKMYIYHDLLNEGAIKDRGREYAPEDEALFYWAGYILMFASYYLKISPEDLWDTYDIESFISSYDVMHTLPSKVQAEELASEYNKAENIKADIFGDP